MKISKFQLSAIVLILFTGSLLGQEKWSVEFRPNIDFPTKDFVDSNVKVGFGFELAVGYKFIEHLGAYAGWGYNNFKIEESEADFDETGYTLGLQFIHPIKSSDSLSYLLRAGMIYNHIEIEDRDGNLIDDSGHGIGWEIGAGLNYNIGANWCLRPQVGYRSLSRTINFEGANYKIDLNYLAFGLGIAKKF